MTEQAQQDQLDELDLEVDETKGSKTLIEIVLEIESRGDIASPGLLMMLQRELDGFALSYLKAEIVRVSEMFPHSRRLEELWKHFHYRTQNNLDAGGM